MNARSRKMAASQAPKILTRREKRKNMTSCTEDLYEENDGREEESNKI